MKKKKKTLKVKRVKDEENTVRKNGPGLKG